MRKFLFILCILVALFALCSCEMGRSVNKTVGKIEKKEEKVVNFHNAPFKDLMKYYRDPIENSNKLSPSIDFANVDRDDIFVQPQSYIAVKENNKLYIISPYDDNHFIFRTYEEVPDEEITDDIKNYTYKMGYFTSGSSYYTYYNSQNPTEVYYVEFEKTDYAFSTEKESDGKVSLGMVTEITGYWNIGPTRAKKEYKKTDLNGPLFWFYDCYYKDQSTERVGLYLTPRAFVYTPDTCDMYNNGEIYPDLETPLYLKNQIEKNEDTFDEENEGWKISSPLGFRSTKAWNIDDAFIPEKDRWPEGIVANLKEDMKQDSAGEWYIDTPDSIVSSESTI